MQESSDRRLDRASAVPTPLPSRGEQLVHRLIEELGEDPSREGLIRTPHRVWTSLRDLTDGYDMDVLEVIGDALFEEQYDETVLVRDIDFYSLCEHHMLPFFGKAHVAYVPDGRIVGLSKLPRVVNLFAHRLQVQERMTTQIADALMDVLHPRGVGVVLEASHLCMMMRGVEQQGSRTVTAAMRGVFQEDGRAREELLSLTRRG
jgi:GTP cyclohydrolase I